MLIKSLGANHLVRSRARSTPKGTESGKKGKRNERIYILGWGKRGSSGGTGARRVRNNN